VEPSGAGIAGQLLGDRFTAHVHWQEDRRGIGTATTLNLRLRASTIEALTITARERGLTMKQVVCQALSAAGIQVAAPDLEDRTPRRR
jgi:hypothetical protein